MGKMKNSPDPAVHQQLERQMMEHVERLLGDERLRVDTTRGRRAVTTLFRSVETGDRGVELKRVMAEMGKPDRELQSKMPAGSWLEVTLAQKKWFFFKELVGKVQVICISPVRALLEGETPSPMSNSEVQKLLTELSMANRGSQIPSTVVIASTSGFEMNANELAEKAHNYQRQLHLYARALRRIYGRPVTRSWLHFLTSDQSISLQLEKD